VSHSTRSRSHKHTGARLEPVPEAPAKPFYRRIPWTAIVVTVLVLISAAFPEDAVRDAITLGPVPEAHLELSSGYLAIAPLSNVLDTLTLLGARQHIVVLLTVIVVYTIVRVSRAILLRRRGEDTSTATVRALRELGFAGLLLAAIVVVYAGAALLPRPMAALVAQPNDVILIADFHAHTKYSHDGRPGWDPGDVRAWHRSAGFDVTYISDHRTVQGAELGIVDNPPVAGQGVMILQALEAGWHGEHVNILGANRFYKGLTTADLRDVDEQALKLGSLLPGREPIVIQTFPGRLDSVPLAKGPQTAGVRAIEIVDGAPRGLDQTRILRSRIVHLADSANIAMVSGSDNHGWGYAAPGWTMLIVPGWRGMQTDSLAVSIERSLRSGKEASRVAERRIPGELNGGNPIELTLTLPIVVWSMFTTLSVDERVIWLVWTWALVVAWRLTSEWRRRRERRLVG
jgi:hypothetical protein